MWSTWPKGSSQKNWSQTSQRHEENGERLSIKSDSRKPVFSQVSKLPLHHCSHDVKHNCRQEDCVAVLDAHHYYLIIKSHLPVMLRKFTVIFVYFYDDSFLYFERIYKKDTVVTKSLSWGFISLSNHILLFHLLDYKQFNKVTNLLVIVSLRKAKLNQLKITSLFFKSFTTVLISSFKLVSAKV